ncbi:hypothetical protein TWF281_001455 [Arthrobotrys megalospora]
MGDARRPGVVISMPILCFLLSCAYVAQQGGSTTQRPLIFGRAFSAPSRAKRAQKSHVVLTTEFSYTKGGNADFDIITNLTIGGSQELRLSVTPQHVTWVPQYPGSVVDFCNDNRGAQNEAGCDAAGRSGYYSASGNTRTNEFSFDERYLDYTNNQTVTGYWVEDKITADGVDVQLQFGVALQWHSSPLLGLGIQPVNRNPKRPGYVDALKQQGKITGRFSSFYNHMTPNVTGEIVLGGVDAEKFQGKLAVWDWMGVPGEAEAPNLRISDGKGGSTGPFNNPGKPLAVIDPLARALFIPNNMYIEVRAILEAFGLTKTDSNTSGLPCDRTYPPENVLELSFNETIIEIQFNDLKGIELRGSTGLCELLLFPTEMVVNITKQWSFILGGPFFRAAYTVIGVDSNSTGIGVLNPTPTGRNIIELGGSFGTSLDKVRGGGSTSTSPPPTPGHRPVSAGAIAGVVIAVVIVLITAGAFGIFFWRRRNRHDVPDIPSPGGYPYELSPDVRPTSELEAKSSVPVAHELPSYTPHELDANTNK